MATMTSPSIPTDTTEFEANASLIATAVLTHPIALQFNRATVAALSAIAIRPTSSKAERELLRRAVTIIDAAEITASRLVPA